ncbi:MAG: hypothetical protein ACHQ52_12680 [Candidatus Eisenbacteria bacterium]
MPVPITINRAPVLTLWAAVVAERLGHDRDAALTLGRAVAGLNAQTKARRLGIARPDPAAAAERGRVRAAAGATHVELLGRHVPVVKTADGLRAATDGRPAAPESVERYLESKFGEHLAAARAAMTALARAIPKSELEERAFALYEAFRPAAPEGKRGWGAKGVLDLARLARLAKEP